MRDAIVIGGSTEFQDDDAALEALVQLKELSFGDVFDERDTSIDSEEGDGISIIFYHTDQGNSLRLHTADEGNVHISCDLSGESILEAQNVLTTVGDEVGEIVLSRVTAMRFLEVAFDSLDFPIREETEHDVTGIRITESDAAYVAQAVEDRSNVFVSRDRRLDEGKSLSEVPEVGESDWEAIDGFIDKFS